MAKITGLQANVGRIKRMGGAETVRAVGAALFTAGNAVQVDAQISITRGAVSGKSHVASRPGEPPNQDTGVLANNIETIQEQPLKVVVSSNAPYSIPLELGTSKMAARPFMRPAAAKNRKSAAALVKQALDRLNR